MRAALGQRVLGFPAVGQRDATGCEDRLERNEQRECRGGEEPGATNALHRRHVSPNAGWRVNRRRRVVWGGERRGDPRSRDPARLRRVERRVPRARGLRLVRAREPGLLSACARCRAWSAASRRSTRAGEAVARAGRAARGPARARRRLRPRLHHGLPRDGRLRALGIDLLAENIELARRTTARSGARYRGRGRHAAAGERGGVDLVERLARRGALPGGRRSTSARRAAAPSWRRARACCARAAGSCSSTSSGATSIPKRSSDSIPERLVRDTWCFSEFEPLRALSRDRAASSACASAPLHDWTTPVIDALPGDRRRRSRAPARSAPAARSSAPFRPGLRAARARRVEIPGRADARARRRAAREPLRRASCWRSRVTARGAAARCTPRARPLAVASAQRGRAPGSRS